MLPLIFQALPFIAEHGKDISKLVELGTPIKEAVVKEAPQLWDVLRKLSPHLGDHPHAPDDSEAQAEAAAATVAKHVFAQHTTTESERAWMDRASGTTGL